jgi:hypothetical protein
MAGMKALLIVLLASASIVVTIVQEGRSERVLDAVRVNPAVAHAYTVGHNLD